MTDAERPSDEDAIRELLDRQVEGWDAGDAGAYASVFTPACRKAAGQVRYHGTPFRIGTKGFWMKCDPGETEKYCTRRRAMRPLR